MRLWKVQTAYAHCDIPCGIYDPHAALRAALTVLRMMDLIQEAEDKHDKAQFVRLVKVKEDHAERVKHEVRIIWGDYFKKEHLGKHPNLHNLVHEIMQLASKGRQGTKRKDGEALLEAVNRFAEIFWETKGIKTKRVKAPQSIEEEMTVPEL